VLDSESSAWPKETGKAAGWQFRGYSLDDKRRPTFRYTWNGLAVEDYPVAVAAPGGADASFRRTITLHAEKPVEHLFFRAAIGKKITESNSAPEKDTVYVIDETLKLKFPDTKPIIRVSENKAELLVPLTFTGNDAKFVEEITW